jgi:hypothetical protein
MNPVSNASDIDAAHKSGIAGLIEKLSEVRENVTGKEARDAVIKELRTTTKQQRLIIVCMSISLLFAIGKITLQSEIIVQQNPGLLPSSVLQKTSWDKKSEIAVLTTVATIMSSINPANAEQQKSLIQPFLSPKAYTGVSAQIDAEVERMKSQRELGSGYATAASSRSVYEYDFKLNKHFIFIDAHTVNAGHDTAQPYVYEFECHVEFYRLVIDNVKAYPGVRAHDSEWIEAAKK